MVGSRVSGYLSNNHYLPFDKLTIPSIPLDFMRTTKGVIYSAGDRVVYKLKNDSISQVGSFNVRINSIFEVSNDVFLFGTNNGAYLFDERTQKLSLYCNQLKDVRVDDIEMFNHNYCFATRGKGLLLMQNNTCRWIGQMEGLPSNLIHKITVDNNTIWCATNNGISRIAFSDVPLFKYSISNINSKDGLASNEVHDLTILRDTLYAATGEGISVFNKKNNFFNAVAPQIYFTSLRINGTDTITSHYYRFPYWMNNIRIGFEALSYKSSGDINYRYLLSNNEDSINNITKNREAEFLSLNPGNYTFTVSAVNSSGIASVKPAVIHFVIQKPFWQEWWFRLLIVALIAVTVSALVRRYIKRIKRQEKIKTEFNKQLIQFEMKALRAQMNPHFIFNVMNSIQDYILKNDAVSAQKYLTKFARLVRLILDNSIKAEVVLQEELKAAQLYVELEQQRFENKFEFIMEVDEMVDAEQIVLPAMIIQPYLENGIKHGIRHLTANGKLILNIVKEGHHIIISIEDNGVGRTESAKRNLTNVRDHVSYGTVITSKRIDAYNRAFDSDISATVIDLTNENGEAIGTKILVSIPIRYKPLAES